MKRLIALVLCVPVLLAGCSGGSPQAASITTPSNPSPSGSAIDLGGTWTVIATSTQGQRGFSGTATVTQAGQGVGIDGTTTLTAPIAQMSISQTGTALSGTITNTLSPKTYSFSGTLSGGNLSATGSTVCAFSQKPEATLITATVSSTTIQGNYTVSRNGCSNSDAGTFVATKR